METLLISVIIVLLVFGVLFWIVSVLPIPAPFGQIAQVVLAVLVLIYLIRLLLSMAGIR